MTTVVGGAVNSILAHTTAKACPWCTLTFDKWNKQSVVRLLRQPDTVLIYLGERVKAFEVRNVLLLIPNTTVPPLSRKSSPPHEVCCRPDLAARYRTLGSELGVSSVTLHLTGLGVKMVWFCSEKVLFPALTVYLQQTWIPYTGPYI
jgi:hypothetical protein